MKKRNFSSSRPFWVCQGRLADDRAQFFAADGADDAVFFRQPERKNGDFVIHTEADRRGVHSGESLFDKVEIGDLVIFFGVGVFLGVAVVDPVDVFGEQKDVRLYFRRAERRARVGGKVGIARSARENDDSSFA